MASEAVLGASEPGIPYICLVSLLNHPRIVNACDVQLEDLGRILWSHFEAEPCTPYCYSQPNRITTPSLNILSCTHRGGK
ncbi:uncharacterized protein BDW43DRAFT_284076 [Aspergillus alliaceus]|uniref:uncharacterized protein n=1 Tax=Petromyces alliaceus TaxID=209559 RepID=UPI0012A71754|nr:uncharacterized protein BDW43DRAFT_284076 [Aspergillus alliaceus]KAB8230824.1 hypothetical protein BDW43DRAFT_284076 [Aspergillus alliaceus]